MTKENLIIDYLKLQEDDFSLSSLRSGKTLYRESTACFKQGEIDCAFYNNFIDNIENYFKKQFLKLNPTFSEKAIENILLFLKEPSNYVLTDLLVNGDIVFQEDVIYNEFNVVTKKRLIPLLPDFFEISSDLRFIRKDFSTSNFNISFDEELYIANSMEKRINSLLDIPSIKAQYDVQCNGALIATGFFNYQESGTTIYLNQPFSKFCQSFIQKEGLDFCLISCNFNSTFSCLNLTQRFENNEFLWDVKEESRNCWSFVQAVEEKRSSQCEETQKTSLLRHLVLPHQST